jgi:hypothetical protein
MELISFLMNLLIYQVLFSEDCSASIWAPALVFYLAPVLAMAALMVVHNAWMALSLHYFAIMIIHSDLNDLRQVRKCALGILSSLVVWKLHVALSTVSYTVFFSCVHRCTDLVVV